MEASALERLETRLAFQEDTLAELNRVIVAQQRQIDRLTRELEAVADHLRALSELAAQATEETAPPHY